MKLRDQIAWLAHRGYAADAFTEGQLVGILGTDHVSARILMERGAEIDDAMRAAQVARAKAALDASRDAKVDASTVGGDAGPRRYNFVDDLLARLFADGRERTTGECARAMQTSEAATTKRLVRSRVVERVAHGRWRKAGA